MGFNSAFKGLNETRVRLQYWPHLSQHVCFSFSYVLPVTHIPFMHQAPAAERSFLCLFFASCVSIILLLSLLLFPSNVSLSFSLNLSKEMKTERSQKSRHMFKIERDTI